jgi:hypothetical protein
VKTPELVLSIALGALACEPTPAPPPETKPSAAPVASTASAPIASTSALPAAPARPLYYETEIGEAELAGRTLRELALMRNTIYARAGNSFRRPWLDEYFRAQSWYQPAERIDESKISAVDRKNAVAIGEHDAAITRAELEKRREEVLARKRDGHATPEDAVELSLLSQRLGEWVGGDADHPPTPIEDPSQLDRLLNVEALSTLSRRDLRILRNTIFARHGRTFDSKVVRSYFEGAKWYKPRADFTDGELTAIDHKNIAIIKSVEDSLGGPLHENPSYGKDGWFVMA